MVNARFFRIASSLALVSAAAVLYAAPAKPKAAPGKADDGRRTALQVGNDTGRELRIAWEWSPDPLHGEVVRKTLGTAGGIGTTQLNGVLRVGRNRLVITALSGDERRERPDPVVVREVLVSNPGVGLPLKPVHISIGFDDLSDLPPPSSYLKLFEAHRSRIQGVSQEIDGLDANSGRTKSTGRRLLTEVEAIHSRVDEFRGEFAPHPDEMQLLESIMVDIELAKCRFVSVAGAMPASIEPVNTEELAKGLRSAFRKRLDLAMLKRLSQVGFIGGLTPKGVSASANLIKQRAGERLDGSITRELKKLGSERIFDAEAANRLVLGRALQLIDQGIAGITFSRTPQRVKVEWEGGTLLLWVGSEMTGNVWDDADLTGHVDDAIQNLIQAKQALEASSPSSPEVGLSDAEQAEAILASTRPLMAALRTSLENALARKLDAHRNAVAEEIWRARQKHRMADRYKERLRELSRLLDRFERELGTALDAPARAAQRVGSSGGNPRSGARPNPQLDNPGRGGGPAAAPRLANTLTGQYDVWSFDTSRTKPLIDMTLTVSGNMDEFEWHYRHFNTSNNVAYKDYSGRAKWNGQTEKVEGKSYRAYLSLFEDAVLPRSGSAGFQLEEVAGVWHLRRVGFEMWKRGTVRPPLGNGDIFQYRLSRQ